VFDMRSRSPARRLVEQMSRVDRLARLIAVMQRKKRPSGLS
jgi:hypothetical protein